MEKRKAPGAKLSCPARQEISLQLLLAQPSDHVTRGERHGEE